MHVTMNKRRSIPITVDYFCHIIRHSTFIEEDILHQLRSRLDEVEATAKERIIYGWSEKYRSTILHEVVERGWLRFVDVLLTDYEVDTEDARFNRPRPIFHTACLKGHIRVVESFLANNLKLMTQEISPTPITPKTVRRIQLEKPPVWHIIVKDNIQLLQLFACNGLFQHYDADVLLRLALEQSSLNCTRYLATKLRSAEKNSELLYLATSKGMEFIHALLSLGYVYDVEFLCMYPNLLKQYYSNIGVKKSRETSCSEFTKLILRQEENVVFLNSFIKFDTLHALLLRMCKSYTRFCLASGAELECHYKDIDDTATQLLLQFPQITVEMEHKHVIVYNGALRQKWGDIDSQKSEGIEFMKVMATLITLGHKVPLTDLHILLQLLVPVAHISHNLPFRFTLAKAKLKMWDAHLSKLDYQDTQSMLTWKREKVKTTFLTEDLCFYTRAVCLLDTYCLDIYDLPGKYLYLAGPQYYPTNIATHFQSLVIECCESLSKSNVTSTTHEMSSLVVTVIILAGQRVNFSEEQRFDVTFKLMVKHLAGLLGMEENYRPPRSLHCNTIDANFTSHISEVAITKSVVKLLKFFMYYMKRDGRALICKIIDEVHQENLKTDYFRQWIKSILHTEFEPLLEVTTLKESCFFAIRKVMYNGQMLYTRNKSDVFDIPSVIDSRWESDALKEIAAEGIYFHGNFMLQAQLDTLDFPPSLKSYITGHDLMLETMSFAWDALALKKFKLKPLPPDDYELGVRTIETRLMIRDSDR